MAPKILGGDKGMNPFSDFGFRSMDEVLELNFNEINSLGKDIYLKSLMK